jgi:hypothetical protein
MSMNVKPKRSGKAIEAPSSVAVADGRLWARASIPLEEDAGPATIGLAVAGAE